MLCGLCGEEKSIAEYASRIPHANYSMQWILSGQCRVGITLCLDYFTKWMEAFAIPNQEAVTVAEKLVEEVFCQFSILVRLHSDQGRQFKGKVMQEVCKLLHINKTRTTTYHPQSTGFF